jgi:hypothetical protein
MPEHGSFQYRLPAVSLGTKERPGFSLWHLTAAKMLSAEAQADFLRQANRQSLNMLLDDLRESMTIFPSSYKVYWLENAPYQGSWSWPKFRELTAWRTPLQICDLVGLPLIFWPGGQELVQRLHPVIAAANVASCQRLGLHLEDW